MRVTQSMLADRSLAALQSGLARLSKTQSQLASGRRLEVPSDDPAGHASATRLVARLTALEQYRRQADAAQASLDTAETSLDSLDTLLGRAQELALRGADGTQGPTERTAMALEVDALLEEAVAQANAVDGGRYVFGGRETLTAPLTVTRNGAGQITAATVNPRGVDGARDVDVAEGVSVRTNVGGTAVLGADTDPAFLPAVLVRLRDALAANDQSAVNATLAGLDTAQARFTDARVQIGGFMSTVRRAQDDDDAATLATKAVLSAVRDADVARLAVEMSQQESVYQAALHAASQAIQPTLLEFLT